MKHLKIEKSKGFFSIDGVDWIEVDKINKENILFLVDRVIEDDEFEMDKYEKDKVQNKAHEIIYRNLYNKIIELQGHRTQFRDESEALYKEALEKYKSKTSKTH